MLKTIFSLFIILISINSYCQDDLMDLLGEIEEEATNYTIATFKTTRIINSHSVETLGKGEMNFIIGHRFGRINSGIDDLFGLDNATIRLGLEYGILDNLMVGVGRSSYEKTYDAYAKYKALKQSTGKKKMPLSMTLFSSVAVKTIRYSEAMQDYPTSTRYYYTFQVMLARKITKNFSLQLSPSLVHRNLVDTREDKNDVFLIGGGGRYKITNSLSINGEYFWILPNQISSQVGGEDVKNMWSIGIDLETGGHVFQLQYTNTRGMIEKVFLTETTGRLFGHDQNGNFTMYGEFHFGFNINRVFTIKKDKKVKED